MRIPSIAHLEALRKRVNLRHSKVRYLTTADRERLSFGKDSAQRFFRTFVLGFEFQRTFEGADGGLVFTESEE